MRIVTCAAVLLASAAPLFSTSITRAQELMTSSPYTDVASQTDISRYLYNTPTPTIQGANSSSVTQAGNTNTANASMTTMSGGSYFNNTTTQIQNGNNNTSTVEAFGNLNTLATAQSGNGNTAVIAAYGSNNTYSTSQTGSGLSVNLTQVGNGKSISIKQSN